MTPRLGRYAPTLRLELGEGLHHRAAADAEGLGELLRSWQTRAGTEFSRMNAVAQHLQQLAIFRNHAPHQRARRMPSVGRHVHPPPLP